MAWSPKVAGTALALLAALLLASCGDGEDAGPAASGPASLMPADAPLYIEAVVSPEGEQADDLDALTAKLGELPLIGTITNPGDLIKSMIEDSASGSGVSLDFAEDVDPWLGERIGAFFEAEDRFVVALETTDEDATKEALQRILDEDAADNSEQTYEGVTYFTSTEGDYGVGVFSGHLVLATLEEFEAAVDTAGGSESLADSDQLAGATEGLADERLATLVFDLAQFGVLASGTPEDLQDFEQAKEALPEFFDEPFAMALGIDDRSIWVDSVSPAVEGQPALTGADALASVPGDAFGAFGVGGVGELVTFITDLYDRAAESGVELDSYPQDGIAAAFEEKTEVPLADATAAIGDGTLWARGELPDAVEIGSQITVEDEETVTALIDELRTHAEEEEGANAIGPPLDSSAVGFSADFTTSDPTFEFELFNVEVSDGSLRLGFFPDRNAAESSTSPPDETLGDSETFIRAGEVLGSDYELLGLADLKPVLDAALADAGIDTGLSPFGDTEAMAAGFIAGKFDVVALGARDVDGRLVQRFALGVTE